MYGVAPGALAAWGRLLTEVGVRADVPFDVIEHAYPATLAALWGRDDLGCAFMCGWPLALENEARGAALRPVIAAPVPDALWSAGTAIYRSDFIVLASSYFRTVTDTFGLRFGYNAASSHSGVNMPRTYLSAWAERAPLYAECVGPLTTVRRCVEAVAEGRAEVSAVDSFGLQVLRRHDPALGACVRVIGSTAPSPIPPLVGGPALSEAAEERLRTALVGLAEDVAGRALLADLCLLRFEAIKHEAYRATLAVAPAAGAFRFIT